jgi:hypothetical protein
MATSITGNGRPTSRPRAGRPRRDVAGSGVNRLPGLDFRRVTTQEGGEWTEA